MEILDKMPALKLSGKTMHPFIHKTFGGLSRPYYLRHFAFGLIFPAIVYFGTKGAAETSVLSILFIIVNTFIYPYSRFVYESVIDFIVGDNVFFMNAIVLLMFKFLTMALCWIFAIFIAPIGLAYLYYHHSKQ